MATAGQNTSGVPVPRFSLKRYDRLRRKLADWALLPFYNTVAKGRRFQQFVYNIVDALPNVTQQVIFDSVHDLAGIMLTPVVIERTAWRLAANIERLQDGIAVPPWDSQEYREWVPLQVRQYDPHRTQGGRYGGMFYLRVLAGTPCPLTIRTFWSTEFCGVLARRVGFTARWRQYPFRRLDELVNLRLLGLIDPQECKLNKPGFREVFVTNSLLKWNRGIIRQRFRVNWKCPNNFTHPCFECPIGYAECSAATHPKTIRLQGTSNGITTTPDGS